MFSVQEYIQLQISRDPSDMDAILTPPKGVDTGAWIYEHVRVITTDIARLIADLANNPEAPCNAENCPVMICTEDCQVRCACHGPTPVACAAIDYIAHLHSMTTTTLCSNKWFPDRSRVQQEGIDQLSAIMRRMYRVLAHARHHHAATFVAFERETKLTKRFLQLASRFNVVPESHLSVPPMDLDKLSC